MKRILTIDLVRGLCIMLMVCAHTFSAVFDRSFISSERSGDLMMIDVMFLLGLAYLSGFTGLFLMISIISHILSSRGQLKKGRDLNKVIIRQIVGGILLLVFAFAIESTLGHHGFIGRVAYFDPSGDASFLDVVQRYAPRIFFRGFHFMTLHTIAWSIIICSLVQWSLYRKGGFRMDRRNVKVFVLLALLVLALTPLAWELADLVVPGYPLATYPGSDRMVQYPLEGVTGPLQMVVLFFLGPLAGQTEPLFPFLFFAFIGCAIGTMLSMDRPPVTMAKKGIFAGLALTVTGLLGLVGFWYMGLDSWTNLKDNTYLIMEMNAWLPLMIFTVGGQIALIFLMLRLIEYRGASKVFARTLTPVRRFAIASLTVYTFQYFDSPLRFVLSLIPGVTVFGSKDGFTTTLVVTALIVIYWDLILRLWSRIGFIGSVEWLFSVLQKALMGGYRPGAKREKWYIIERLKVLEEGEVEWVDLREGPANSKINIERDSKLAYKLSLAGLIFMPLSLIAFGLAWSQRRNERTGRMTEKAYNLSRIGILLGTVLLLVMATTKNFIVP
ncbi:MAG: hypothetical protein QCI82_05765 [Candidatus Thermoplasmatota archaeon]|nr:hypothetical protein [Candidatus Thermoplasmatota archaeon]